MGTQFKHQFFLLYYGITRQNFNFLNHKLEHTGEVQKEGREMIHFGYTVLMRGSVYKFLLLYVHLSRNYNPLPLCRCSHQGIPPSHSFHYLSSLFPNCIQNDITSYLEHGIKKPQTHTTTILKSSNSNHFVQIM